MKKEDRQASLRYARKDRETYTICQSEFISDSNLHSLDAETSSA